MIRRFRRKSAVAASPTPLGPDWQSRTYVVVDLETTGLDWRRDQIVAFGAVVIRDGVIHNAESRYGLVHPSCPVSDAAVRVHGLRAQDLAEAPPLDECLTTLDALLRGNVLVAHCASIERRFLTTAFRDAYLVFDSPVIDTEVLARHALGIDDSGTVVSLEYAATALGLPVFTPHHALGDAMTTATLFLALAHKIGESGPTGSSAVAHGALGL
ncbi:3'-5' exonuclease [Gordonia sp. CPCC 205515]|uniref:3'-5' exonuclease n=1 Tax=Gordonia sp. CPCC 205515 TaxID=3140791 RepID=UPI003AF40A70